MNIVNSIDRYFSNIVAKIHSHEAYSTTLWLLHGGPQINPQIKEEMTETTR